MHPTTALALDAAPLIGAALAAVASEVGSPFSCRYRQDGLSVTYRASLSTEQLQTVSSIIAEKFEAAGWDYWHRYSDAGTIGSTDLTHPTDISFVGRPADRRPSGLGASLSDLADQFGAVSGSTEAAGALPCGASRAMADLLEALGLTSAAVDWRAAHAGGDATHDATCAATLQSTPAGAR